MNVVYYNDSLVFGGHEQMAIDHLIAGSGSFGGSTTVALADQNDRARAHVLEGRWCKGRPKIVDVPPAVPKGDQIVSLFSLVRICRVCYTIWVNNADIVCVIAGRIEAGTVGLIASLLLCRRVIAYVPMVHRRAEVMPGRIASIRDAFNSCIYRAYDRIVCITPEQAGKLRRYGARRVGVIPNSVEPFAIADGRKRAINRLVIGYLGRLDEWQKNVLHLPTVLRYAIHEGLDCSIIVQGSGPAREELTLAVERLACGDRFQMRPWAGSVDQFFSDIDVLILPSRFEGVPLVMLQAIARGIPVVATRRDGMQEWLPDQSLFDYGDTHSAVAVLQRRAFMRPDIISGLRARALLEANPSSNGKAFYDQVMDTANAATRAQI